MLFLVYCYFCNFGESLRLGLQYSQRFEGYSGSDYCGLDLSLGMYLYEMLVWILHLKDVL